MELEYSCLSTKLSLSEKEKNVPSEGSKKNIENIINTHSCKIPWLFFFTGSFFVVGRRELQDFVSFCLVLFMSVRPNLVSC